MSTQHATREITAADPFICAPEHKHDDSTYCFNHHGCRCTACHTHYNETVRERRKLQAYGRFDDGLVDAGPVREHLEFLHRHGLGFRRVAELADVSATVLRALRFGWQSGPQKGQLPKRVKRETAERVLAVEMTFDALADHALVSSSGAIRRLQALVARGWSIAKLARELGMQQTNLCQLMRRQSVAMRTHRIIAELFDDIWDSTPPLETRHDRAAYTSALKFAAARRWLPPLAWDDIDTDPEPPALDDETSIDEIAVDLALSGEHVRLTPAERRLAVGRAHERRWSDELTAETIGCAARTVFRIREELGLEAWPLEELETAA